MTYTKIQEIYDILNNISTKEDDTAREIARAKKILKTQERVRPQFLFVEDGSIDVDNLEIALSERDDVDIQIVVYRQGSNRPELISMNKENK